MAEVREITSDVGGLRAPVTTLAPTDRSQSRKLVLVSVSLLLAINVYRAGSEPGSLYKRLWGTGVLGVVLALAADFAPQVAGPFAMLVALGAFTRNGDALLQAVTGKIATGVPVGANVNPATNPKALGPVSTPATRAAGAIGAALPGGASA